MATEVFGNLPPNVVGPLHGFLSVSLKKLKWIERRDCSSSTVIQLKWWGEKLKPRKFLRPHNKDVRQQKARYAIRCSLRNFEAYIADIGVLTIYVMSEQGQVFGSAIVDKLPSSDHPVINTSIPVMTNTGQQIASMSVVFNLEETARQAPTPCSTKNSNVQDTVAGLLIKSHELQKAINLVLEEKNPVTLLKNLKNFDPVDRLYQMTVDYFNVEGKPIGHFADETSLINEVNAFGILNHPPMFSTSEGNLSNEIPHCNVFESNANVAQHLSREQSKNSFQPIRSILKSKLNKEVTRKAKGKFMKSDVPTKLKSTATLILNESTNKPDVMDEGHLKKCSVLKENGPLMHCLLNIPKGDGLLHAPIPECFNTDYKGRIRLYLVVRMLWLNEILCSDVSSTGKFAFHQVTLVQMTHQLLSQFHDNFVSIEVWKKMTAESDQIIGICKLPLHLFYLAFRDANLTESLSANSKAVVAVDDMLPVEDLFCGKTVGRLQIFFAMGTEQQIKQLQDCPANLSDTNSLSMETIEHFFEVTINHLILYQPPLSNIWGESDCFVQYMFPAQDDLHPNCPFHLTRYTLEPRLCQERIQFKTTLKHNFLLPKHSLQRYFSQAFPMQKLPLQVWCRYYNPKEEDRLIAEANIPLSNLFRLIPRNDYKEILHLNLEPVNTSTSTHDSNTAENMGFMEICINYNKLIKRVSKEICSKPSMDQTGKEFPRDETEDNLRIQHLSDGIKESFSILVNIERAAHLPSVHLKSRIDNSSPNCCVTVMYTGSSEDLMKTPVIDANTNPCWDFEDEITIPFDLLVQRQKNLLLHVWHIENESDVAKGKDNKSQLLIGIVFVDLSPLLYGMHKLSGWYNVVDFEGLCNGQVKVTISPQHGMETAKAIMLKLPMEDRLKESELLQDLKVHPAFHESVDASRSLLIDNLRNKLTHLEQMLKNVSHVNNHDEDPEDTSDVEVLTAHKNRMPPMTNKCKIDVFDIPSTRRGSRVAAAIFDLD